MEICPTFETKGTSMCIYYINLLNWPFLAFLTSENDVICTVMLQHLSQFGCVMVRYNVQKELFPRLKGIFSQAKIPFLFPSKITENSFRNVISVQIGLLRCGSTLSAIPSPLFGWTIVL